MDFALAHVIGMLWVQHYWDPNPPAGVTRHREQVTPLRLIGAKFRPGGAYCRIATAVSIAAVKNFLGLFIRSCAQGCKNLLRWFRAVVQRTFSK
jgi:hypothetical protein